MAITYTWSINPLEAYPSHGGEADVIFNARWQLQASSGSLENSGSLYTAIELGSQPITYHSGSEFIPFNELTLEIVQGWVEEGMGETQVNNIKALLATRIENQINPPVVILPSPWLPTGSL